MKNLSENIAVILVGVLSLLIVFLIVQYTQIGKETTQNSLSVKSVNSEPQKKAKSSSYLDSLEGYGEDVDVKVDATKESSANTVTVESELADNELDKTVEDTAKASYVENLSNYHDEPESPGKKATTKTEVVEDSNKPEELPSDEIEDEIGTAIDAALGDL